MNTIKTLQDCPRAQPPFRTIDTSDRLISSRNQIPSYPNLPISDIALQSILLQSISKISEFSSARLGSK